MAEIFLNYNELKIDKTTPCLAMPEKIKFITMVNKDISGVFPYLNAIIDGAIYNKDGHTIMFNKEYRRVSMFANMITGAKVDDIKDAELTLQWTVDLINDCWNKRGEIEPNYERRQQVGVIDILKLLPGINCKKCGQYTCMALAAAISQQKDTADRCSLLFTPEYAEKRKLIGELLTTAGYSVSTLFL